MQSYPHHESETGPVSGYTTLLLFELPEGATPEAVAAFFERRLSDDRY